MIARQLQPAARALPHLAGPLPSILLRHNARWASHDSHGSDPHGHEDPNEYYPPESFFTPFWRNIAIVSVGSYLTYQFWPVAGPDGESWLSGFFKSRVISSYNPDDYRSSLSDHIYHSSRAAENFRDVQGSQRPSVHRYRYRGMFDQASPNLVKVGEQTDMSDLVVKTYADFYKDGEKIDAEKWK